MLCIRGYSTTRVVSGMNPGLLRSSSDGTKVEICSQTAMRASGNASSDSKYHLLLKAGATRATAILLSGHFPFAAGRSTYNQTTMGPFSLLHVMPTTIRSVILQPVNSIV